MFSCFIFIPVKSQLRANTRVLEIAQRKHQLAQRMLKCYQEIFALTNIITELEARNVVCEHFLCIWILPIYKRTS